MLQGLHSAFIQGYVRDGVMASAFTHQPHHQHQHQPPVSVHHRRGGGGYWKVLAIDLPFFLSAFIPFTACARSEV